jgi:Arc/MetJ-type ribon-helix-helix transcriptional regulator
MQLPYMGVAKVKITTSVKQDLIDWIDIEIGKSRFASRTHAVEYALTKLKEADNMAIPNRSSDPSRA